VPDFEILYSPEVADALASNIAVVALESTISSTLGLPVPYNAEVVARCNAAIRSRGGVPAMTAIIDGRPVVGVTDAQLDRVLSGTKKCAERDVPIATARKWDVGVTTVSGTLALCVAAGIRVFATGGIGGVHRDDHLTGDVSADLGAIARFPVITVTAGGKAFLDLPKTVELLDTLSVPVLGMGTDYFPAFYSRSSGVRIHHRIDSAIDAASIARARWALGGGGVVVANPIPEAAEIPNNEIDPIIGEALAQAARENISGAALTPFVLGVIGRVTEGRSIPANLALAENNAAVATEIAVALLG
jgi:pseudouridylate synthase